MVQAAAGDQLRSPIDGKQVSGSRSMWPVLVFGILTAIFAWIWYRRRGEVKEPETPVQLQEEVEVTAVTPQQESAECEHSPLAAHLHSGESKLNAADPDRYEPNSSEQEVACLKIQETVVVNPEIYQARNEQQPKLQVKEKELPDVDNLEVGSNVAANTNVPLNVQVEAIVADPPSDVPTKVELQGNMQEHKNYLPKKRELHNNLKEQTDIPRKEELQADLKAHPTDVSSKEALQTDIQEHPTDVLKKEGEQANVLEHQTVVPVKEDNLLEKHLKDLVQTNAKESYKDRSKNDVHSHSIDMYSSDIPAAREMIMNGDEAHIPLKKEEQLGIEEGYPQDNLHIAVVQANGEVMCPTLIAEEPEGQKLQHDTCHARMSGQETRQGRELLRQVNDRQDIVYAYGEVNGAKQAAENATGCPLENSFVVKENAMNILEAKESFNQDQYLEMVNTASDDGNYVVAKQFMKHESVEKCDIKRMSMCSDNVKASTGLQDDADVFASSLNESFHEGSSNVQKLKTGPESSPVDIYNLMCNQEKEMAGLSSSNIDEKTSGSPSETNIHEIDHQKTRKVATIQPMPQNVNFAFKVHYITHSDSQIIAATGDHEKLGKWESYVPLTSGNSGFWSRLITLPADTNLAWKFVMVENGKIKRWEECSNRVLKIAHEDIEAQLYWGYP